MKYNLLYLLVLIEPEYINTSWTPVSHWTDADGQTPNRYNFKTFDFSIDFLQNAIYSFVTLNFYAYMNSFTLYSSSNLNKV